MYAHRMHSKTKCDSFLAKLHSPSAEVKEELAVSLITMFPSLKDPLGSGYDAFYVRGRAHHPATGALEERLRNVRKRSQQKKTPVSGATQVVPSTSIASGETSSSDDRVALPESTVSAERATEMTEWLKYHMEPEKQVKDYMSQTAAYRLQWIRNNGTLTVASILAQYPRLLMRGMIEQDFRIMYPSKSYVLFEKWATKIGPLVIEYANRQRKDWKESFDASGETTEEENINLSLQALSIIIPVKSYKKDKKMHRPSFTEASRSFIDAQPVSTNIPEYLRAKKAHNQPFVLILGDRSHPAQTFLVLEENAVEQPSLMHAVDCCFKTFYIMDLAYPHACYSVWEFFEGIVFDMKRTENLSNQIKILRSYFNYRK